MDFNFCIKHLKDFQWATGSQDTSLRIWDIRKPDKEILLIAGEHSCINRIEYIEDENLILASENYGIISAFQINDYGIKKQSEDFMAIICGISLSPSK